jgi:hypothetical protein
MIRAPTFLYFAYGSNLLTRRLRGRTPWARPITTATLPGHELRWHKPGRDGSGKRDIVQSVHPDAAVIGVVYEIPLSEKPALDQAEGLGNGYDEKKVTVHAASGPIESWTYYARSIDPSAVPYTWYKALVVAGAREHALPGAYVDKLEAVVASIDPEPERAAKNFAMVEGDRTTARSSRRSSR